MDNGSRRFFPISPSDVPPLDRVALQLQLGRRFVMAKINGPEGLEKKEKLSSNCGVHIFQRFGHVKIFPPEEIFTTKEERKDKSFSRTFPAKKEAISRDLFVAIFFSTIRPWNFSLEDLSLVLEKSSDVN
ncbi:hypothetical protein JTE90_003232 [Oedothorax gibbosus]|uniref:Uncharacterized protein n=1 Tax=Oedothorax gibbosus TaxID=931172 RepID=A0AAV6UPZ0_9ARAC|nr:hypothetical protein JTE90_003232 [Oedothorax gibbosus]